MHNRHILASFGGILLILGLVSCTTSPREHEISRIPGGRTPQDPQGVRSSFAVLSAEPPQSSDPAYFSPILAADNSDPAGPKADTPEVPTLLPSQTSKPAPVSPGTDRKTFAPPQLTSEGSTLLGTANRGASPAQEPAPGKSAPEEGSQDQTQWGRESPSLNSPGGFDTPGAPALLPQSSGNAGRSGMAPVSSLTMGGTPPVPDIPTLESRETANRSSPSIPDPDWNDYSPGSKPLAAAEGAPSSSGASSSRASVLSAQYQVQSWEKSMDCFWNIAGKPWVYEDPTKWVFIYYANISKLPNPENPDILPPGLILDIPSLGDEVRQGISNAEGASRR